MLWWILLNAALNIILWVGTLFLTGYFKKKGENVAQKQDIAKLTNLVEAVRREFNNDLEVLKANLSVNTDIRIKLYDEQKLACFEMYALLNQMEQFCLSFPDDEDPALHDLKKRDDHFIDLMNKLLFAMGKVELLFNNDEDPVKSFRTAYDQVLQLTTIFVEIHTRILHELKGRGYVETAVRTKAYETYLDKTIKHVNKYVVHRDQQLKASIRDFILQRSLRA